ncbi:DUF262 domain-containing protein [Acidisphaera sp. L21]|uniref:DUF262 domain-containing protein n=1 Tax=Acidisphaera sp. L21 TaxID=1641851 RepID=UPI00131AD675|nr:DUF262 domain-containing protein [Acidisphaera sp. L21]
MKNFDSRVYNIGDFREWFERNQLELSPQFQRRSVWTPKAKSYLIDSIVRGKPIPKLLLTQETRDKRNIRTVVDGQQRLRAIMDFMDCNFTLSRAHNKDLSGIKYDNLPSEVQSDFLKYEVGVDLLYDIPYKDILDIFARLNTYNMRLNSQELLNAQYVGYFKQIAYNLGYEYVEYFVKGGVLSEANVSRMAEANLTSDLLISLCDGVQSSKALEGFYRKFDDEFPNVDKYEEQFNEVMSVIGDCYRPDELTRTNWSRVHLFYTMFSSIAHIMFGLNGLEPVRRNRRIHDAIGRLKITLDDISARFDEYSQAQGLEGVPPDYALFIDNSRRGTTDTGNRQYRSNFVCAKIIEGL